MEYVFGKAEAGEFVRVDGELFPGIHDVSFDYPDMVVSHKFCVGAMIKKDGKLTWYKIDQYSKTVDKSKKFDTQISGVNDGMSIAFVTLAESGSIDTVTAWEHKSLFADWQADISYAVGSIRRYGDKLYKCLQAHTSQKSWEPDATPSLWKIIGDPAEEYPEWSQPIGAGDGYKLGDKVSHNEKRWASVFDGENVWEPGVFGWEAQA